jgi:hypothetical protein
MNVRKLASVFAGMVWAAAAISHAAPADAIAITLQSGAYASCSASYDYNYGETCWNDYYQASEYYTYYRQEIKLWSVACGAGGGCSNTGAVYTDFVYPAGRRTASGGPLYCGWGYSGLNAYELGSCAC